MGDLACHVSRNPAEHTTVRDCFLSLPLFLERDETAALPAWRSTQGPWGLGRDSRFPGNTNFPRGWHALRETVLHSSVAEKGQADPVEADL